MGTPRKRLGKATILCGCLLVAAAAGSLSAASETSSSASAAAAKVQAALADMNAWLAGDKRADAWNEYLKTDALQTELKKGRNADRQRLDEILAIYSRDSEALAHPRFVAVRRALSDWREKLSEIAPEIALKDLPAAIEKARDDFRPVDNQRFKVAQDALRVAMDDLDSFLAGGGEKKETGWKELLKWSELETEVEKGLSASPGVLAQILARHQEGKAGMELSQFANVRMALRDFVDMVAVAKDQQIERSFRDLLDELADDVRSYIKNPTRETHLDIARKVGWLERAGQAPGLVKAVRRRLSKPNLHVRVDGAVVVAGMAEDVDFTGAIRENIIGTSVHGTARTKGKLTAELEPNQSKAAFDIYLNGTAYSNNVGYNRGVSIYSNGVTSIKARKRIYVTAEGLKSAPAVAECSTNTTITGIGARSGMVRNAASRQVAANKYRAEYVASQRAKLRVEQRMDSESREKLAKANEKFENKFRKPLLRRDQFPELFAFSTTDEALLIRGRHATEFQLGAPTEPPTAPSNAAVSVRAHESVVNNFAEGLLGGLVMTDEMLAKAIKDLTDKTPEELQPGPDKEPWSITFAKLEPVTVKFEDGHATVSIRGRRFTRGDQEMRKSLEISAKYKFDRTDAGARLVRQGDVEVKFLGAEDRRLTVTEVAFKTFIKKKFGALFKPEKSFDGLTLPGAWSKLGKLRLESMSADSGWLALAWRHPEKLRTAKAK